jgi:YD repeat-containing protein
MKQFHFPLAATKTYRILPYVIAVFLLFKPMWCVAQQSSGGGDGYNPINNDYKKVPIPPSPNASALGKFGDIPVSASTGIPEITIPIYSYHDNLKNLNISVSLKYHSGGHKVEDMASNVGLGWALSAGGVIMRTMKGLPDDMPYGYLKTPPLPLFNTTGVDILAIDHMQPSTIPLISEGICLHNSPSFLTIKGIVENAYDGESDIFNLSIGSINEKFFFDKNGTPVFMTPNNLRLEYTYGTGNHFIEKFTLTDSKGVSYFFDILEYTQTDNAIEPSVPAPPMYISAWYLSRILAADEKDEIQFHYENTTDASYETGLMISYMTEHRDANTQPTKITHYYNTTHIYQAKRISEIILPDKTAVDFNYALNREDYANDKALTSIEVSGDKYKKLFRLNYDYFVSGNCYIGDMPCPYPPGSPNNWQKRLKLLSIQEESGSTILPPYLFEYNSTPLPFRNSKDQDWGGHYNGGATGALMSTATPLSVLGYDRIPSLSHCKAWILEGIKYPTGGKTRFTYELNEGFSEGVVKPIGGLRIQKKKDYDPLSDATYTTTYTYSKPDGTTSGVLITIPSYTAYSNSMLRRFIYGGAFWVAGKNNYLYETLNPTQTLSYFNGSPVIYTRVKEEQYVSGASNGYKIYEFTAGTPGLMHDFIYPFVQKQDFTWERGLPLKTSIYNSIGSLLVSEENEYQTISTSPPTTDETTRNLVAALYQWDNLDAIDQIVYGARYYYLWRGKSKLIKTTKKEYTTAGNLMKTVTEYAYDDTYHLPISTKTTDSKGKTKETKIYYPFHYNSATYPLMGQLVLKNRVDETISTEEWITENGNPGLKSILINDYSIVNTNLIKKTKTSILETNRIVPLNEVGVFDANNMYRSPEIKERVRIEAFDSRGRGIEFKYNGGETHSLIWGDHNEFPIASITNAEYADVAYSSFETHEKGNWQFTETASVTSSTAPTGKKVYPASTGISKNLNGSKTYIVSLWRNGNISVSNASLHHTGKTIDNWVYEEYKVSNSNNVNITGSGYVDELRIFPSTSQMTSYTYHTPQQMASESDHNGSISRYEYDELGRLKTIKDEEKNIIKKFDYHYEQ